MCLPPPCSFKKPVFINKQGFTLAEVLIALVIVGIIAAITVPALIAKYQKEQFTTAFKKAYSELSNAVILSQTHNGPLDTWDYSANQTVFFKQYILPYLQISKDCGFEAGKGCFAPNIRYKYLNGSNYREVDNDTTRYKVVLNNGMSLNMQVCVNCINELQRCIIFQVDINGNKKPNQIGRDFFSFSAYPFTNNLMPDGIYSGVHNGYNTSTKKWKQDTDNDCTKTGTGWGCAGKIMKDGWQIKNDYPW